jgi:hypothetical protein
MPAPDGSEFWLSMDLSEHQVRIQSLNGTVESISMTEGYSAADLGKHIQSALVGMGLSLEYDRTNFDINSLRDYEPQFAEKYASVLLDIDRIFKIHRSTLDGETGPVQLWPHGFDLSFEWFGTRVVESNENGAVRQYPAQLSLGFSPGEPNHPAPYFYSNPWPFETGSLVSKPLPPGASWFTAGWQGGLLPYAELVGDSRAEERLLAFARAVYGISRPTLVVAS